MSAAVRTNSLRVTSRSELIFLFSPSVRICSHPRYDLVLLAAPTSADSRGEIIFGMVRRKYIETEEGVSTDLDHRSGRRIERVDENNTVCELSGRNLLADGVAAQREFAEAQKAGR